jgi:hypothetical protein
MQLGDYIIASLGKDMIRIPAGKGQNAGHSVTLEQPARNWDELSWWRF